VRLPDLDRVFFRYRSDHLKFVLLNLGVIKYPGYETEVAIKRASHLLLLMLWAYAAVSKINEYDKFVLHMQLAPVPLMGFLGPTLGWFLPTIELLLVGMLLTDRYRNLGLLCSFALLVVFEGYIVIMLLSGLDLPCTCGGLISKLQWKEHLVFNAVFMLISIFPFLYQRYFNKSTPPEYSPRESVGVDI
jgi:putative oxidoreductase